MNKKRLSVVMAGAMLATSVAPVLAAETTATTNEYSVGQKELLVKYLENKLKEKEYTKSSMLAKSSNATNAKKYFEDDVVEKLNKTDLIERSAYTIKKNGTPVTDLSTLVVVAGDKIEIFEEENDTFFGQLVPGVAPKVKSTTAKYEEDDLKATGTGSGKFDTTKDDLKKSEFIEDVTLVKTGEAKITFKAYNTPGDTTSGKKTLTIKTGDKKLDLNLPLDKDGENYNLLDVKNADDIQNFDEFANESTWVKGYLTDKEAKKVETINIVADAPTEEEVTYNASDLYDGTLLTEKGTELLNDIKNAVPVKDNHSNEKSVEIVEASSLPAAGKDGITTFTITYKSKGGIVLKKVYVKSANRKEIEAVYKMLKHGKYGVGIVAGKNRYETAVNVAKESGVTALEKDDLNSAKFNVVLVNGTSLVDGLAAAPLAAQKVNGKVSAPLLLTKADSLPKETKDYLNKLVEAVPAKKLSNVTVSLVGGRAVLSDSLVKELKGMGFSVERFGGDNREETSLKVAAALSNAKEEAFVVGANGEADAMSISAVAATTKTPIIVSSVHGLTEDATDYLGSLGGNATIIGGEKAITKEEEEKIKEAKEDKANAGTFRIAGENRTETNAKILDKYADTLKGKKLTIVKDGSNNKEELVDALSAANLGGPIVLANSKLSDAQLSKLLKLKTTIATTANRENTKLLQVGLGLEDSIIKSLSKTLNITNEGFKFN